MCFGPKNVEKLRFLGVFMSALRASENSLFISNDIQMHKIVVYLDAKGVATIKQIIFSRKKTGFGPKKRQRKVFFGVFRHCTTKNLRSFAALIRLRSNLQASQTLQLGRWENKN